MNIDVQVDEPFATDVDPTLVERAAQAVLEAEGMTDPVEISVLVTSDTALHDLNRTYRGVDAPTDVLSFASQEGAAEEQRFVSPPDEPRHLGDIAISYQRVLAQAADYGHSPERELAYLTAHGVLHLLGYDHERSEADAADMRAREEAAMERLGLTRES